MCQTGAPTALRPDEVVLAVRSIGPGRAPGPCGPANQVRERIESGLGQNRALVLYCSGWRWSAGGVGGSNLPVATIILSSKILFQIITRNNNNTKDWSPENLTCHKFNFNTNVIKPKLN